MAKVTLEQWRMLHAVVEHGGFAQASLALHKSQSTISYAVNKLQQQLNVEMLTIKGRKAELTEAGDVLLRRSAALLKESEAIEYAANNLAQGWEGSITVAADVIFPPHILDQALIEFAPLSEHTRLELVETVLSGTSEMLESGEADLAISGVIPKGMLGEPLMHIRMVAIAHRDHPLHQLQRTLTNDDLKAFRQIVLRDSGAKRIDAGWLAAEKRWTVSTANTSLRMIKNKMGFAWLPETHIHDELSSGELLPLDIDVESRRQITAYLIFSDKDYAGPATRKLADILKRLCLNDDNSVSDSALVQSWTNA